MTGETYVPLSRGLREHLPKLSGNAIKLYLLLLMDAKFAGPDKGTFSISFRDLASDLSIDRQTAFKAARELRPYYIEWTPGKNQFNVTQFRVKKYKVILDFAVSHTTDGTTNGKRVAGRKNRPVDRQHTDSTPHNPHEQQDLLTPKNERRKEGVALPSEAPDAWEYAKAKFIEKYDQEPDWSARKHWQQLLRFMKKHSLEEFRKRWDRYIWTADHYYQKQRGSLAWFCANSDYFVEGETQSTKTGKPNGGGKFARAGFGAKAASQ